MSIVQSVTGHRERGEENRETLLPRDIGGNVGEEGGWGRERKNVREKRGRWEG